MKASWRMTGIVVAGVVPVLLIGFWPSRPLRQVRSAAWASCQAMYRLAQHPQDSLTVDAVNMGEGIEKVLCVTLRTAP